MKSQAKVRNSASVAAPGASTLKAMLRDCGVMPTAQRLEIARVLFARHGHHSAEDIYGAVNRKGVQLSKATVYNTLGLFVDKGLIRQVVVDPAKTFYDPNTDPHHHFYDLETGELTDIDANRVKISGLPELPSGKVLDGVDVIVRVRQDD